jgi:hypothetical protein
LFIVSIDDEALIPFWIADGIIDEDDEDEGNKSIDEDEGTEFIDEGTELEMANSCENEFMTVHFLQFGMPQFVTVYNNFSIKINIFKIFFNIIKCKIP